MQFFPHCKTLQDLKSFVEETFFSLNISINDFEKSDVISTLRIDSLATVRLVVAIENRFRVEFLDSEVMNIKTFGDVAQAIEKKLSMKKS